MRKYICKICGEEFDRVGNGVYCPGPHYRPCPVCGTLVLFQRPSDPIKCCSKECTDKLSMQTKMNKPMRPCAECGKLFTPKQATQKFCEGPHITLCEVCGKEIIYTCRPTEKPRHCSQECINKSHEATVLTRYGVSNISMLDETKQKISEANSSDEVREKREATCLQRYGVTNVSQNSEIQSRLSTIMRTSDYLERRKQTCRIRYGYDSPMQSAETVEKRRQSYRARYNRNGRVYTTENYASIMTDRSKAEQYVLFKENPHDYLLANYVDKPTAYQLAFDLGVTDTPIYDILVAHNCQDMISHYHSSLEIEVVKFLQELVPNIVIKQNDRTVISPQEIDIYLPEYDIGIECNPTHTHNSSFSDRWGGPPKHYCYHQDKSLEAEKAGIFLFHIFGYEWCAKKEIIKSMIANLLGESSRRIFARNAYVCELSDTECKQFLDANHRQGAVTAKVRLGLRLRADDELVSVMTFNHVRHSMGKSAASTDTTWELSRFCSLLNTNVTGAAGKLFKHFVESHPEAEIISFSDVAHTRGHLYEILGFEKVYTTSPSYVWVTEDDKKYYHRVSCQKQYLRKLFNDDTIDIENQTEKQIMEAHKFARVFDSGVVKWRFKWNRSV